jgi:hypothetical protein
MQTPELVNCNMRRINWQLLIRVIPIVASAVLVVSCSKNPPDCGYSAYYDTKDKNGKIEIMFSLVTAEGNDPRNCGFEYIPTRVARAEIDGNSMPERVESDKFDYRKYYLYLAPPGFDMQRDVITIHFGDTRYVSDPATFKKIDSKYYVKLKRAN